MCKSNVPFLPLSEFILTRKKKIANFCFISNIILIIEHILCKYKKIKISQNFLFVIELLYMDLIQREKFYITRLAEIDSTNSYAKANLADIADRTVVCADKQTAGHGRFDRAWVDLGSGNIFMSLVLKPSNDFKAVYANLTQYFSVILCEILEEYGLKPQIKWPNDVLVDGKKIAGILSETVIHGQYFKGLVLGAGINLNANSEDLAQIKDKEVTALNLELEDSPSTVTSCHLLPRRGERIIVDKSEFLDKLLNSFFENYDEFLNRGFALIKDSYIERACFLNQNIDVKGFKDTVSGFAKSVNDAGELVLQQNNKEVTITMGDIL